MSFVSYTPRPGVAPRSTSLVFDPNSLHDVRRQVKQGGGEVEVAKQFESLFIQMMMKQARASSLSPGLFQSDGMKMVQSMQDEQMALELAQGQGMGLAEALVAMMRKGLGEGPADEAGQALSPNKIEDGKPVADSLDALIDLLSRGVDTIKSAAQTVSRILPADSAPKQVASFIQKIGDAAVRVAKDNGIHPELIMSQAALESGWGRREIKHENGETSHNIFGIKATSNWKGKVVHVMTTEYVDGVPKKMSQPFRAYDSYDEALSDYARLISTSGRYASVVKAPSPEQAAREVQKSGYATDPDYANKLISIMDQFKAV